MPQNTGTKLLYDCSATFEQRWSRRILGNLQLVILCVSKGYVNYYVNVFVKEEHDILDFVVTDKGGVTRHPSVAN